MRGYNKRQVEAFVLIRDGLSMAIDGINRLMDVEEPEDRPQYDLEKISWTTEKGNKGEYEKATEQDSVDYRALLNDLEAHDGKLQRQGFFIWKFTQGNSIGRKVSRR